MSASTLRLGAVRAATASATATPSPALPTTFARCFFCSCSVAAAPAIPAKPSLRATTSSAGVRPKSTSALSSVRSVRSSQRPALTTSSPLRTLSSSSSSTTTTTKAAQPFVFTGKTPAIDPSEYVFEPTGRVGLPIPRFPAMGTSVVMNYPVKLDTAEYDPEKMTSWSRRLSMMMIKVLGLANRANLNPGLATKLWRNLDAGVSSQHAFAYDVLGLEENFHVWFTLRDINCWMLFVRFRKEGESKDLYDISHYLMNELFGAAEERLFHHHQWKSAAKRDKLLKTYLHAHHGMMLSLDEALQRGDAVLAMALYRNVFAGNSRNPSPHTLALLVQHIRRQLYILDRTPIEYIRDSATPPMLVPSHRLVKRGMADDHAVSTRMTGVRSVSPYVYNREISEIPAEVLRDGSSMT